MKPAPFGYVRPGTLPGVLEALAEPEAKVLAGGQSLIPVLAMRLGRPSVLVDIAAVPELGSMSRSGGRLRMGASVRQRAVEHSEAAREVPLLGLALPFVGHRELRSRGTVCGSLAHADPAAELPSVACCLGATLEIAGPAGRRWVRAEEFCTGAMTTLVGPDEVLVAVEFPVARPGEGFGFAEVARRHGDFALAGVATRVAVDPSGGHVLDARLVGFGISDRPVVRDVTELVRSADGSSRELAADASQLARDMVDTQGDAHASTGYRRRLLAVLAARELAAAHRRARAR
ncbi:xanthine dehydrogenase family protein subunit M [Pseudonocardia eucalypti]|uniref:Xanthine dehydrogenase family protein subunit M n=1 Tax=Pseudonocardia eucalypti TaxID=648755 RepID=A0ABP9QN77_9PSEU|nr:carbon-monoxide dehydrogenase medium subunit [Pseudonocardia eucalypti]